MKTLAERQRPRSLSDAVKWLLARQLSGDRPDILAVARGLGVGERSLQRRLGGEGTSFQVLLNAVRRARGRELLADPALDIDEVAFLLGYEGQNSFFRAFRKRPLACEPSKAGSRVSNHRPSASNRTFSRRVPETVKEVLVTILELAEKA
jgi:AraC-like DNA-binding protein